MMKDILILYYLWIPAQRFTLSGKTGFIYLPNRFVSSRQKEAASIPRWEVSK